VQVVGFRSFIYRLVIQERLAGFVLSDSLGVKIEIEDERKNLYLFSMIFLLVRVI